MRSYNVEACNLFLSCVIQDPACLPVLIDRLDDEDFPLEQRLIWRAITQSFSERCEPTLHEVLFRLERMKQGAKSALEVVGKDFVESLPTMFVNDTKKVTLFVEQIEASSERALLDELYVEAEAAKVRPDWKFDTWWNEVVCHVMDRRKKRQGAGAKQISEYWSVLEPALEAWFQGLPYMRITTGFKKFDNVLGGGLLKKELHIIAGSPGTTKTLLALTMSKKQAQLGYKVLWSSLEMPGEMLFLRLLCASAGIDWSRLMSGQHKGDMQIRGALERAKKEFSELPFFVDDRDGVSTDDVHWQALRASMTDGLDVLYIDFAQLLSDFASDAMEKAAKIFRNSKVIAKLLGIPVVVLSQVTKDVEKSESKLPQAVNVPFSGHDVAGFVIMTWDVFKFWQLGQVSVGAGIKDADGQKIDVSDSGTIYYVIAKARYGREIIVKMSYSREIGRISDPMEGF